AALGCQTERPRNIVRQQRVRCPASTRKRTVACAPVGPRTTPSTNVIPIFGAAFSPLRALPVWHRRGTSPYGRTAPPCCLLTRLYPVQTSPLFHQLDRGIGDGRDSRGAFFQDLADVARLGRDLGVFPLDRLQAADGHFRHFLLEAAVIHAGETLAHFGGV